MKRYLKIAFLCFGFLVLGLVLGTSLGPNLLRALEGGSEEAAISSENAAATAQVEQDILEGRGTNEWADVRVGGRDPWWKHPDAVAALEALADRYAERVDNVPVALADCISPIATQLSNDLAVEHSDNPSSYARSLEGAMRIGMSECARTDEDRETIDQVIGDVFAVDSAPMEGFVRAYQK